MDADVLVLGAGAAGLHAARVAFDLGARVIVLEAAEVVGGRMRTLHVPGVGPVELGAEFVHGRAPLTRLLVQATRAGPVRLRGRPYEAGPKRAKRRWDQLGAVLGAVPDGPDRSVDEALAQTEAPLAARDFTRAFLTGFHALDPDRASIHAILEEEGRDPGGDALDSARLARGQSALLEPLLLGIDVRTRTPVTSVAHDPDGVAVVAGGRTFTSRRAVVALPLGVLPEVRFDPPLAWPLHAVASGAAQRIVLVFGDRSWDAVAPKLGFLSTEGTFRTFWSDRRRPVLTAWCGGPAARALSALPAEERVAIALRDLRAALGTPPGDLRAWYTHDWLTDPLARGVYSYVAVGGLPFLDTLKMPRGSLMLAGEYVPGDGVSATVEAALASGMRAGQWSARGLARS